MKHILKTLLVIGLISSGCSDDQNDQGATISGIKQFRIKPHNQHGSKYTWWGYNMSKVARHNENVYFGILKANDDAVTNANMDFVIYKVTDSKPNAVVNLPTNVPGNVLVDSNGGLHVIIFEPIDVEINHASGAAVHYYYESAGSGDFTKTARHVIDSADNPHDLRVNIRIGASISKGDRLAVAFGAPAGFDGYTTHTVKVYLKEPGQEWKRHVLEDVAHEYYYPFVVDNDQRTFLLPVQDDFAVQGNKIFNRYYKIPLIQFNGTMWSLDMLIDRSDHPLAVNDEEPQLVTQLDLFERSNGDLIAIYRDESGKEVKVFTREISKNGSVGDAKELKGIRSTNISWVSAFEIDSKLYYFGTSWHDQYFIRASDQKTVKVSLPDFQEGAAGFLSSARGGANQNDYKVIDILSGAERSPSEGASLYQIPKKSIKELF